MESVAFMTRTENEKRKKNKSSVIRARSCSFVEYRFYFGAIQRNGEKSERKIRDKKISHAGLRALNNWTFHETVAVQNLIDENKNVNEMSVGQTQWSWSQLSGRSNSVLVIRATDFLHLRHK